MATDPNSEMLTASEFTVKAAKKDINKTLDYSIESLKILDALIQHVRNHFTDLEREGKLTEQIIQRASVSIGAYLGEVIRRNYGGTWRAKTLVINSQEFSPIYYIFQRLTKDLDYSLEKYLSDVKQKLQPPGDIENKPPVLETPKKTVSILTENRGLIIGGVIGIAVLCILGIVGITIYSNIKANNEFKAKMNSFILEANKLSSMTEQGVTYDEFRTQLVEVKSAYALINNWPSSYRDEKLAFDKAIEGWNFTFEVWDIVLDDTVVDMDESISIIEIMTSNKTLVDKLSKYDGIGIHEAYLMTSGEWIGELMVKASMYFEAGKAGIK